jgi:hypothetical protein
VKPSISLCAAAAMLMLPTFAWSNSPSAQPGIQAFSYRLGDQAQTLGVKSELGAIDPADLGD